MLCFVIFWVMPFSETKTASLFAVMRCPEGKQKPSQVSRTTHELKEDVKVRYYLATCRGVEATAFTGSDVTFMKLPTFYFGASEAA